MRIDIEVVVGDKHGRVIIATIEREADQASVEGVGLRLPARPAPSQSFSGGNQPGREF
ncbi:hypothetical protein ACFQAT_27810 [Undibacterium arcticum]|uniref:Uncharacterized protein n=1 Tax=Undibacterium arcticum TaxID=1762892 RepID=A0ABV7F3J5_9BURK